MARISLLTSLGRWNEVLPMVQEAMPRVRKENTFLRRHLQSVAGVTAARLGNAVEAARLEAELAAEAGRHDFGGSKVMRARIAAHLGQRSRAVGLLQQALAEGANLTIPSNIFEGDGLLLPLRGYAPFMELLKPVG